MKTFLTLNSFSKKASVIAALVGTAVFFNSCKNNIDNTSPAIAALTVVNAYPDANPLDFYMGGSKVNNTGLAFGQKIDYFRVYEGSRSVNVTAAGSLTSLLTKSVTLKGGFYHSLFVTGKAPADLDFLLLEDNFAPQAEKVSLRFVNLAPDAAALSLEIAGDTTKFDDRAYKSATSFKNIVPAKANLVLRDKASNIVKASLDTVNLVKGKVYTIYAKGLENSSSDLNKLELKVSEHQMAN